MFPQGYFTGRYFLGRYFPKTGQDAAPGPAAATDATKEAIEMFINKPYTTAYVAPPSGSTTLTALLADSNVSIPSSATQIMLQAQGAGVRVGFNAENATTSSFLLTQNMTIILTCQPNLLWFNGNITVSRDATGANLSVNAFGN